MTGRIRAALLGLGAVVLAMAPLQSSAAGSHATRQLIRYSRLSTWGSASAACSTGEVEQTVVPSLLPYVCVGVRFSTWQGYHRGRITLSSPHGLSTAWTSFNGRTNHPILHGFSIQTVDLVGAWTVSLRVDGRDIARATFTVAGAGSAPTRSTSATPSVAISPASPPPGYTVTTAGDVYELTDTLYGARLDLSRFTLTRQAADGRSVLSFYVRATKIPSRDDTAAPTWDPGDSILRLIGSDLRPYAFYTTFCSVTPVFRDRELRNGESSQGWICSEGIPAATTTGRYTLTWSGAGFIPVPVLNVELTTSP